jgi:hypothetical protein
MGPSTLEANLPRLGSQEHVPSLSIPLFMPAGAQEKCRRGAPAGASMAASTIAFVVVVVVL